MDEEQGYPEFSFLPWFKICFRRLKSPYGPHDQIGDYGS